MRCFAVVAAVMGLIGSAFAQGDCDGWVPIGDPGWRAEAAAALDPVRNKVVMYGGARRINDSSNIYIYSDTWEFDGARWTPLLPATTPGPRMYALMAYDPASARLLMHGGLTASNSAWSRETWAFDGVNWSLIDNTGPQLQSQYASLSHDPNSNSLWATRLQFAAPLQLYRFQNGAWTEITAAEGQTWPGANWGRFSQFDPVRNRLVVLGTGQTIWEYDGATWTAVPANLPSTSYAITGICYSPLLGLVVLVNGQPQVWNGTTLTNIGNGVVPSVSQFTLCCTRGVLMPGGLPGLIGDFQNAGNIVYAGCVQAAEIGAASIRMFSPRPSPTARMEHGTVPLPGEGVMIVGGTRDTSTFCPSGVPSATSFGDTWLLRGEHWRQVATGGVGTPAGANFGYEPGVGPIVLGGCAVRIGGVVSQRFGRWNGTAWETVPFTAASEPSPTTANANAIDAATGRIWVAPLDSNIVYVRNGSAYSALPSGLPNSHGTIAYDPVRGGPIRFGSQGGEPTRFFNGAAWVTIQNAPSVGPIPYPGKYDPMAVYDPGRQAVVAFGGFLTSDNSSNGFPGATYFLASTATTWTRTLSTNIPGRKLCTMAYDPTAERVVLFGGFRFDFFGDTWKLARGPAAVAVPPAPATVERGSTATFEVIGKGGGVLKYQWRRNTVPLTDGGRINGAATDMLTIASVSPSDGGTYDVIVTNPCGNETSAGALLIVTGEPCPGDVGRQGGEEGPDGTRDNNDFIVFIDFFFDGDPRADLGSQGGLPGADEIFDNNDFVVFIDFFFSPC